MMPMSIFITAALWKFLAAHQVAAAMIGTTLVGWTVSAYASTIDQPPPGASRATRFWYTLVHTVAANLDKLKGKP